MHRQSWRDRPRTHAPRFGLRPQVPARNKWGRIEALQRNARFIDDYLAARARWLVGQPCLFPFGTYWLACFAFVPVADPPEIPTLTHVN